MRVKDVFFQSFGLRKGFGFVEIGFQHAMLHDMVDGMIPNNCKHSNPPVGIDAKCRLCMFPSRAQRML